MLKSDIEAKAMQTHEWLKLDNGYDMIPKELKLLMDRMGCQGLRLHRNGVEHLVLHYRAPWSPSPFRDIEDPSRYIVLNNLDALYKTPREDLPRIAALTDTIDGKEILAARMLELGL